MKSCVHIFIALIVFGFQATGQKLLFHKNRNKQTFYESGDVLTFRLKGSKQKFAEPIIGFEDSLIVFWGFKINPKEVSHLYVDKKTRNWYFMRFKYANLLLLGGAGYLILDVVNFDEFNETTLIISGTLIGAGILAKILIHDRIRIKGRKRLIIFG